MLGRSQTIVLMTRNAKKLFSAKFSVAQSADIFYQFSLVDR